MDFETAWQKVAPRMQLSRLEAQTLYHCAQKARFIIEIGTLRGESAYILGATGNLVETIDNYSSPNSDEGIARGLLKEFPNVKVTKADSVEAGKSFNHPIDLLFIDGDHSYESVKNDIEAWLPHFVDGGLVLFHDYGSWHGVTEAVNEAIGAGKLHVVAQMMTLLVTKKL